MDTESSPMIKSRVIVTRIVVVSLLIGVLIFMCIAVFMVSQEAIQPIGTEIITYLSIGMLLIGLIAQFSFVSVIEKAARKTLDPNKVDPWLQLFQNRTIMGCALLEGPAFLGILSYMMERNVVGLYVGGTAAVLMFLFHFPTEQKVISYVNRQRELAIQERV